LFTPLFDALDRVQEVAIDTEADNLFRYRTRVCLLQIMAGDKISWSICSRRCRLTDFGAASPPST